MYKLPILNPAMIPVIGSRMSMPKSKKSQNPHIVRVEKNGEDNYKYWWYADNNTIKKYE